MGLIGRNAKCHCGSGLKYKRCHLEKDAYIPPPLAPHWNGERCDAERVIAVVGKVEKGWWCEGLEGTSREAVRVVYNGEPFFIDNEDGSGWDKVTKGLGSPHVAHKSLPVERWHRKDSALKTMAIAALLAGGI